MKCKQDWNGGRAMPEYSDKQFRRHLALFIIAGIGMYALIAAALVVCGVA